MSEENKYTIQDLITSSLEQKPLDFSDAFSSLMVDRLRTAIEDKKIDLARNMYSPTNDESDNDQEENYSEEE